MPLADLQAALGQRQAAERRHVLGHGRGVALHPQHIAGAEAQGTQPLAQGPPLARDREHVEAIARAQPDLGRGAAIEPRARRHHGLDQRHVVRAQ